MFFKLSRNHNEEFYSMAKHIVRERVRDKCETLSYKITLMLLRFVHIVLVSEMRVLFLAIQTSSLLVFHICRIKILWRRYNRVSGYILKHLWSRYYESRSRGNHAVGIHPRRITRRREITFSLLSSLPSGSNSKGSVADEKDIVCPLSLDAGAVMAVLRSHERTDL